MSFENQGAVSERTLQLRNILYMLCKGVKGGHTGGRFPNCFNPFEMFTGSVW